MPFVHVFVVPAALQPFDELLVLNVCQIGEMAQGARAHQRGLGRFLQWPLRQVGQEDMKVPEVTGGLGMSFQRLDGFVQIVVATDFCNRFSNGAAAADGDTVLVKKFVVVSLQDTRLQIPHAMVLVQQRFRDVLDQWRIPMAVFALPFAIELLIADVVWRQETFQPPRVPACLMPVFYWQDDVHETACGEGFWCVLQQKARQFLQRRVMADEGNAVVFPVVQPVEHHGVIKRVQHRRNLGGGENVVRNQAFQSLSGPGSIAAVEGSFERPFRADRLAHGPQLFQPAAVERAFMVRKAAIGPTGFGVTNQKEVFHRAPAAGVYKARFDESDVWDWFFSLTMVQVPHLPAVTTLNNKSKRMNELWHCRSLTPRIRTHRYYKLEHTSGLRLWIIALNI